MSSFYPAVPPLSRGPSFPGARADSPLSRSATSPLRFASRHPFVIHLFQPTAFSRERASTNVSESLGPRARFRALCRTPRFFEPRCRRTNSAIRFYRRTGTLIERLSSCASTCVDTFLPSSVTRRDGYEPRNSSQGCYPEAFAPELELWRPPSRKKMALNSRGPGDPSEGSTEMDFPPQATSRASESPSRFENGVGAPPSCIVTVEDPRRTAPREGLGCPSDQDAFHCFGILAWSRVAPRARLDHLAVTPTPV